MRVVGVRQNPAAGAEEIARILFVIFLVVFLIFSSAGGALGAWLLGGRAASRRKQL